jgi:hypothetical protein
MKCSVYGFSRGVTVAKKRLSQDMKYRNEKDDTRGGPKHLNKRATQSLAIERYADRFTPWSQPEGKGARLFQQMEESPTMAWQRSTALLTHKTQPKNTYRFESGCNHVVAQQSVGNLR